MTTFMTSAQHSSHFSLPILCGSNIIEMYDCTWSSLAGAGLSSLYCWTVLALVLVPLRPKNLRASKRANHISSACLLSFPACKTATQGIHRALQANHRPLISSAQNLTIYLVSTNSINSTSKVTVNKDTTQNKSASTPNHNYKEEIRT